MCIQAFIKRQVTINHGSGILQLLMVKKIVGAGGYKGKPKEGKVEIAYGTFKKCEGQGVGTEICRQLVLLSLQTDPGIRITARTLQDGHASIAILKKNGFECLGIVYDKEDGNVLEWEFKSIVPT